MTLSLILPNRSVFEIEFLAMATEIYLAVQGIMITHRVSFREGRGTIIV
jgi:hypothetical protein